MMNLIIKLIPFISNLFNNKNALLNKVTGVSGDNIVSIVRLLFNVIRWFFRVCLLLIGLLPLSVLALFNNQQAIKALKFLFASVFNFKGEASVNEVR